MRSERPHHSRCRVADPIIIYYCNCPVFPRAHDVCHDGSTWCDGRREEIFSSSFVSSLLFVLMTAHIEFLRRNMWEIQTTLRTSYTHTRTRIKTHVLGDWLSCTYAVFFCIKNKPLSRSYLPSVSPIPSLIPPTKHLPHAHTLVLTTGAWHMLVYADSKHTFRSKPVERLSSEQLKRSVALRDLR